jgi:2-hydroxy-1,4-benzoquinone reductase
MYTIISGTNRTGSHTLKVAKEYQRILKGKGIEAGLFSLEGVNLLKRDKDFEKIEEEIILPTTHFIIVSPEYNGSFPGALKLLMDTSKNHLIWWNKKALLVGISAGKAGNLRGMDHLADILNFLKITVHPNKLPISVIDKLLDGEKIKDENTLVSISKQLDEFLSW